MIKNLIDETLKATPLAAHREANRLIKTPSAQIELEKLQVKLGKDAGTKHQLSRRFQKSLREMASVNSPVFEYLFDNLLGDAHTHAFTVDVDTATISHLKKLNKNASLVFLPSHRSYADPFIMARTVVDNGLKRTRVLGGDNLSFFPFGAISRRSGGIFIRRQFGNDPYYKAAIRATISNILAEGDNLEWYLEGGRSRSGKLLAPKVGLLKYLFNAKADGVDRDIILVPTSITYEQLHEVKAMLQQDLTGYKPKEGMLWLADYARKQRTWVGNVHVRFGEPMSLNERIAQHEQAAEPDNFLIEKTAIEVFRRINEVTPVTAQALVTLTLLSADGCAMTLSDIHKQIRPLLDYIQAGSLPNSLLSPLNYQHGVLNTLNSLIDTNTLEVHDDGSEPVYFVHREQYEVAAFYRNSAIHWFVNRAILELAMFIAIREDSEDLVGSGKQATLDLRDLLKFEFFFNDKQAFRSDLLWESNVFDENWKANSSKKDQFIERLHKAPFIISHAILPSFLEAYWVMAKNLAEHADHLPVDSAALIQKCIDSGRRFLLQKVLHHPESISKELFKNALKLAKNRGLLDHKNDDIGALRAQLLGECERNLSAINGLRELNNTRRSSASNNENMELENA